MTKLTAEIVDEGITRKTLKFECNRCGSKSFSVFFFEDNLDNRVTLLCKNCGQVSTSSTVNSTIEANLG